MKVRAVWVQAIAGNPIVVRHTKEKKLKTNKQTQRKNNQETCKELRALENTRGWGKRETQKWETVEKNMEKMINTKTKEREREKN